MSERSGFDKTNKREAVNAASATVVSVIANIKDFSTRQRLAAKWSEIGFEILESIGGFTLDPSKTRDEHIADGRAYAQKWCEEIRTLILNAKREEDSK